MVGRSTFAKQSPPTQTALVVNYQGKVDPAVEVKAIALDVALEGAAIEFSSVQQLLSVQGNSGSRGKVADGVFHFEPQHGGTLGGQGNFRIQPGNIGRGTGGIEKGLGGHSLTGWTGDPDGGTVGNLLAERLNRFSEESVRRSGHDGQIASGEVSNHLKPGWAISEGTQKGGLFLPDNNSFYLNTIQHAQLAAQPSSASKPGSAMPPMTPDQQSTEDDDDRKPTVYRSGRLPRDLPEWFERLDTDRDGQIGLYEWVRGGGSVDEFRKYDRNDDGFITIEEMMSVLRRSVAGVPREG